MRRVGPSRTYRCPQPHTRRHPHSLTRPPARAQPVRQDRLAVPGRRHDRTARRRAYAARLRHVYSIRIGSRCVLAIASVAQGCCHNYPRFIHAAGPISHRRRLPDQDEGDRQQLRHALPRAIPPRIRHCRRLFLLYAAAACLAPVSLRQQLQLGAQRHSDCRLESGLLALLRVTCSGFRVPLFAPSPLGVLQLLGLCGMGFILWPKAQNSYVVLDEERDNPYDGL